MSTVMISFCARTGRDAGSGDEAGRRRADDIARGHVVHGSGARHDAGKDARAARPHTWGQFMVLASLMSSVSVQEPGARSWTSIPPICVRIAVGFCC